MRHLFRVLGSAALLCMFSASFVQAGAQVLVKNKAELGLQSLSLVGLPQSPVLEMDLETGQSGEFVLPAGTSRLKADMGMVRFVFPAHDYSTAKRLVLGKEKDGRPYVLLDSGTKTTRIAGVLVNLGAADRGWDEAVFEYSQFLPPADVQDVRDVIGLDEEMLAQGWQGGMSYGDLEGKGSVRGTTQVRLVLEFRLSVRNFDTLCKAWAGEKKDLWRGETRAAGKTLRVANGSFGLGGLQTFRTHLPEWLRGGQGRALLLVLAQGDFPEPADSQGCTLAELDFSTKVLRVTFPTVHDAKALLKQ